MATFIFYLQKNMQETIVIVLPFFYFTVAQRQIHHCPTMNSPLGNGVFLSILDGNVKK